MHISRKSWLVFGLVVVLALGAVIAMQRYRYRLVQTDGDLLGLLPGGENSSLFFADVSKLRAGGYLKFLAGSSAHEEKDYAEFMRATGFDWQSDIDAAAATTDGNELFAAVKGRLHPSKIQRYLESRGGSCADEVCSVKANEPGRWLSMVVIQPDVIGLATGTDRSAARRLRHENKQEMTPLSDAAVWVRPSRTLLSNPAQLPVALQIFAIAMQSADSAVLSLRAANENEAAFQIEMKAWFENQAAADTARNQLETNTKLLKLELIREHKQATPGDLASLLTSGTFSVSRKELVATWPVQAEFLKALE